MNPRRLRSAEHVPPPPPAARHLRGLPQTWDAPVPESEIDGLLRRARATATALAASAPARARELQRRVEALEAAEALRAHALRLETVAQLYRALSELQLEAPAPLTASEERTMLQAGALDSSSPAPPPHGPAVVATTSLRNRAFRLLAARTAQLRR